MNPVFRMLTALLLALSAAAVHAESAHAESAPAGSAAASGSIVTADTAASYEWRNGPLQVSLLDQARLDLPAGFSFLDQKDARLLLQRLGNPNVADVLGVVTGSERDWLAVLRFEKAGYVREDEGTKFDLDPLLAEVRQGALQTNAQRQKQQVPEIEVLGWLEPPRYDPKRHQLSWGIVVRNKDDAAPESQGLNFNTYLLGREGYLSLNLVTGMEQIIRNKAHAETLISAIEFRDGKRYTDHAGTDKLAFGGMKALFTGAAEKSTAQKPPIAQKGFFARFGKLIIGIVVALLLAGAGAGAWFFLRKRKAAVGDAPASVEPTMEGGEVPSDAAPSA